MAARRGRPGDLAGIVAGAVKIFPGAYSSAGENLPQTQRKIKKEFYLKIYLVEF